MRLGVLSCKLRESRFEFMKGTQPNVRDWITKYIEALEQRIEQAKVDEEREF